jgi:hypothetical protein
LNTRLQYTRGLKMKNLVAILLFCVGSIYAAGGDTVTVSTRFKNVGEGDTIYQWWWTDPVDSTVAVVNGRLGDVNLAADANIAQSKIATTGTFKTDSAYSASSFTAPRIRGTNNIIGGTVSGTTGLFTGTLSVDSLNSTKQIVEAGTVLSGKYLQGNGTAGTVPRYTAARTLADGVIRDDGTNVGVGVAPSRKLHVQWEQSGSNPIALFDNIDNTNGTKTAIQIRQKTGVSETYSVYLGVDRNSKNIFLSNDNMDATHFTMNSIGEVGIATTPVSGVALTVAGKTVSDTIQAVRARVDSLHSVGAVKAARGRFDSLTTNGTDWFKVETGTFACSLFSGATLVTTGTAHFQKTKNVVTVTMPSLSGSTSGAVTVRALPVAIRPIATTYETRYLVANGIATHGVMWLNATGIINYKVLGGAELDAGVTIVPKAFITYTTN